MLQNTGLGAETSDLLANDLGKTPSPPKHPNLISAGRATGRNPAVGMYRHSIVPFICQVFDEVSLPGNSSLERSSFGIFKVFKTATRDFELNNR